MFFFYIIIIILVILDNCVYHITSEYINKLYIKSIKLYKKLYKKLYPNYKLETKQSENTFIIRLLVLPLFWLSVNLFIKFSSDIDRFFNEEIVTKILKFINYYQYIVFIMLGCIVYFIMNLYSNTHPYFRNYDILTGIVPTSIVVLVS